MKRYLRFEAWIHRMLGVMVIAVGVVAVSMGWGTSVLPSRMNVAKSERSPITDTYVGYRRARGLTSGSLRSINAFCKTVDNSLGLLKSNSSIPVFERVISPLVGNPER